LVGSSEVCSLLGRPKTADSKLQTKLQTANGKLRTSVRLDLWLDVACLFKTRSEAQKACRLGKIAVNGQTAKAHREVRPADEIEINRPFGRRQKLIVRGLAEKHIPKAEARGLYEDVTPAVAGGGRTAADGPAGGPVHPAGVGRQPRQARAARLAQAQGA